LCNVEVAGSRPAAVTSVFWCDLFVCVTGTLDRAYGVTVAVAPRAAASRGTRRGSAAIGICGGGARELRRRGARVAMTPTTRQRQWQLPRQQPRQLPVVLHTRAPACPRHERALAIATSSASRAREFMKRDTPHHCAAVAIIFIITNKNMSPLSSPLLSFPLLARASAQARTRT